MSSNGMELSWHSEWASGNGEGASSLLPLEEGREEGGGGGGGGDNYEGGDNEGGITSPGSDLYVNTMLSLGSTGGRTTVSPRTRKETQGMKPRSRARGMGMGRSGAGAGDGDGRLGMDDDEGGLRMSLEAAQASLRSDQTKSEEEPPGTSLFHRMLEQRQLLNPDEELKFLLQRLVVIACLPQCLDDRQSVGAYYEKLNQRLQRLYPGENITGLLLIYPTCILHVIESSSEVLSAVMMDLSKMEDDSQSSVLEWPRVLLVSHDVPCRLFKQWEWRELNLRLPPNTTNTNTTRAVPSALLEDPDDPEGEPETTETLVSQVLQQLMKLGNHLLTTTQTSTPTASPDKAVVELPEGLLVPQGILSQLLQSPELLSPQQYLQAYHTPLHLLVDSEHVFSSHQPTTV